MDWEHPMGKAKECSPGYAIKWRIRSLMDLGGTGNNQRQGRVTLLYPTAVLL